MSDPEHVLHLLRQWRAGDHDAYDQLVPFVYAELRRLARTQLRRERADHSFQPTALVHEAYMRLARANVDWQDRTHFLRVAARAMRQVLVEHARGKRAMKRGGDQHFVELTGPIAAADAHQVDVLVLDQALARLRALDAREADVVELSYFGGLTYPEIADALAISEATVHRTLRHARAWLKSELSGS